jgi:hypothetical protein
MDERDMEEEGKDREDEGWGIGKSLYTRTLKARRAK